MHKNHITVALAILVPLSTLIALVVLSPHGAPPLSKGSLQAATAICDAAEHRDVAKVAPLLQSHTEVLNATEGTHHAATPLHFASSHGRAPVVELPLSHGADTTIRNRAALPAHSSEAATSDTSPSMTESLPPPEFPACP